MYSRVIPLATTVEKGTGLGRIADELVEAALGRGRDEFEAAGAKPQAAFVYEWEDSPWAKGQQPPIEPERELGVQIVAPPNPGPDKRDQQLRSSWAAAGEIELCLSPSYGASAW